MSMVSLQFHKRGEHSPLAGIMWGANAGGQLSNERRQTIVTASGQLASDQGLGLYPSNNHTVPIQHTAQISENDFLLPSPVCWKLQKNSLIWILPFPVPSCKLPFSCSSNLVIYKLSYLRSGAVFSPCYLCCFMHYGQRET